MLPAFIYFLAFLKNFSSIGALLPRKEEKEMQVLAESQVIRFLIAAEGSRYKALYHLAITTGMRYGELTGLKWSDIDWERYGQDPKTASVHTSKGFSIQPSENESKQPHDHPWRIDTGYPQGTSPEVRSSGSNRREPGFYQRHRHDHLLQALL